MVRAVFEGDITATIRYPDQDVPETVRHDGRDYTLVGESEGERLSCGERLLRLVSLIGLVAAVVLTLFIPLAFKSVRSLIADWTAEICSGREKVVHWHSSNHINYYEIPETKAHNFVEGVIIRCGAIMQSKSLNAVDCVYCWVVITANEGEADAIQFLFRKEDLSVFSSGELSEQFRTMEAHIERMLAPLRTRNLTSFSFNYLVMLREGVGKPPYSFETSQNISVHPFPSEDGGMLEGYSIDGMQSQFQRIGVPIDFEIP